jgi:HPt (histidine-containing phosphotransfer) domain-containing protein
MTKTTSSLAAPSVPREDRTRALQLYFEGSTEIFEPFREACLVQFPLDLVQGHTASAAADLSVLRRVAHSLKSVLLTLGYFELSDIARQCEATSHAGDLDTARQGWTTLAAQLQWIIDASSSANPDIAG